MNERQLRSIIRQVIHETQAPKSRLLVEDEEGGALYKAFGSPFIDLLKGANLFTKDVLNIFGFAVRTFITFSPKRLLEARQAYNARRDKIEQEWKPLMDKGAAALENSDIGLAAMVLAPNVYFGVLGAKIADAGIDTADQYLQATGIKQYVTDKDASLTEKLENYLANEERDRAWRTKDKDRKGLSGQLRVFFFGEAAWQEGEMLNEADGDASKNDSGAKKKDSPDGSKLDINKLLQELFGEGGPLEDMFASSQKEMLEAKKEQIDSLVGTANTIISGLRSISEAKSLEDFEKALKLLKSQLAQRGDKEPIDLSPIETAIQGLKTQMENKYAEVLKGKSGPAPEGADKGDIETVAKKASQEAFASAAGELKKMATDAATQAAENYKSTIMSELTADLPKEGPLGKALSGSKAGKDIADLIKNAVGSIGAADAT